MMCGALSGDALRERRGELESALCGGEVFWREMPFRIESPQWVSLYPEIDAALSALSDSALASLLDDNAALLAWLGERAELPILSGRLIVVPRLLQESSRSTDPRHVWGVPGRKLQQIEAFLDAAGAVSDELLEWCSGKGHLGRLHHLRFGPPVVSLEIDEALCAEGARLADRAGVKSQRFVCADALGPQARELLDRRHVFALHACGDLHRNLVSAAAISTGVGLDLAPCCYYRLGTPNYQPFARESRLALTRDDLHLAVTETVTAPAREIRGRDRETAMKLAFVAWRSESIGEGYHTFKPVPDAWMRLGLAGFLGRMCQREGIAPPPSSSIATLEAEGHRRLKLMMRRSVVRLAFRRIMELWLVCDLAEPLLLAGFEVGIREFCARKLTPRNLMLSARR